MDQDTICINRTLQGDFSAFEELVDKYQGRIYRHLRKMVHDNSQAEDLLQETFLSAYKGLGSFTGASSFSTWLFRIATNAALMFLRKNVHDFVEYDDALETQYHEMMTASPEFVSTPLEMLLSMEGKKILEQAIDELPLIYRTVMILRDIDGFTIEETADVLGLTIPAVKSRLHRARNIVREALTAYYMEQEMPDTQRVS
ncbi:MAG: RNA polymerase sigma factor [Desulfomonilaceae bacterium]